MKINSVWTQDVDARGQVVSQSKTIFKVKPQCDDHFDPFYIPEVEKRVNDHQSQVESVERFIVTISTNKGKFIKTFKAFKTV
jgi:hypothetical protein